MHDAVTDPDPEWSEVLTRRKLGPHRRFAFPIDPPARATHVRLNIHPDGGVARLRVHGRVTDDGWRAFGVRWLNAKTAEVFEERVLACCGSRAWASGLEAARPFATFDALLQTADDVWEGLSAEDRREAFAAHPRIGERGGSAWARGEQAGAAAASDETLRALETGNREYEERFGHVFLINATGRSAEEMLEALRERLRQRPRDRARRGRRTAAADHEDPAREARPARRPPRSGSEGDRRDGGHHVARARRLDRPARRRRRGRARGARGDRLGAGRGGPDRRGRTRGRPPARGDRTVGGDVSDPVRHRRLLRCARRRDLLPGGHGGVHRADRRASTTTCRCCSARSATRRTGGADGVRAGAQPVRQGGDPPRHRGARRGASRVLRARDRGAPGGRLRRGPHRGRQRDGAAHRHDAELGLRARVRASGRGARDVRAPLHEVPPGRLPRGEPGRGLDDRAALGARRDRRRAAPARVHARRVPMDDPRGPRPRRASVCPAGWTSCTC